MEVVPSNNVSADQLVASQQLMLTDPDDQDIKTPKKRAETWAQEEMKALIAFRKEMDSLFNTSKSNKHLWEQIAMKMKDRGYERSGTMCTDKWRNLLKEYKRSRREDRGGSAKFACYKDLEELLGDRSIKTTPYRSPAKLEASPLLSPKGPMRSALNLERRIEHEGHPTAIPSNELAPHPMVVSNGISSAWNWRDTGANGEGRDQRLSPGGKVIVVKCGDMSRRIRIDGPSEFIKDSIKSAFGLRTKRLFWLEDEEGVVQTLSRDMPLATYYLNLDQGVTVKVCTYDEQGHMTGITEPQILYTEDDFREFLSRKGWCGLREVGGIRDIHILEELQPGGVYERALR
eukprot:TRINITY_DN8430_c0_g1_i1.p1 TRINITY_DN8430_c0_g1~~TRINITY_DN8430_c0_g1_i1.p1  ORF type:complete len:345 (+),score=49.75 TRINITY_DN8430_c0_g1_i1:136-1170(+)